MMRWIQKNTRLNLYGKDYLFFLFFFYIMKRRNFIGAIGASATIGLSGCISVLDNPIVDEFVIEIVNDTDVDRTFHFMLDSNDRTSPWYDFSIDKNSSENYNIDVETVEWTEFHAISGHYSSTGTLFGETTDKECIQLQFMINEEEGITSWLSTSADKC